MIIAGRPLKRPALCTSTTLPLMPAPSGITTLSPTRTGEARLARKVSPFSFSSELNDSVSRTASIVPSGTIIFGALGGVAEAASGAEEGTSDDTFTVGITLESDD